MHHPKYMRLWHVRLLHGICYFHMVIRSWVRKTHQRFIPFGSSVMGVYRRASFIRFPLGLCSGGEVYRGQIGQAYRFDQYGVGRHKGLFSLPI